MNKPSFLDALGAQLKTLPQKERQQYIDYYAEMIDDRMEDGVGEAEAVEALGSIEAIAAQILADAPQKPARRFRIWEIVLIVLGSPIWLTLGFAVVMVLLSLVLVIAAAYIVLWSVIVVLYAADLTLLAGLITGIAGGCHYALSGLGAPTLMFFGGALVCGGVMVLLFFGCNKLAVWLARLGKWAILCTVALFRRKREK